MLSTQTTNPFLKVAETYDEYADIQHYVANQLIESIPDGTYPVCQDWGCGTGKYTSALALTIDPESIYAIDSSPNMIAYARTKNKEPKIHYESRDISTIELSGNEDLIFSSSTLQWVPHLDSLIQRWSESKKDSAILAFSLFGPKTFWQLQDCLSAILNESVLLPATQFYSGQMLGNCVEKYFKQIKIEQEIITKTYDSVEALIRSIKYTGTKGDTEMPKKIWTKSFLNKLNKYYTERFGAIHASYQFFTLILK